MKRAFDIVISLVGLMSAGWLVLLLIFAVRLTSAGPGIFAQRRVGRDQKPFTCYKLRTMYTNTPDAATHMTKASAVTPLGHWMRKFKLDELPQLWNVLKGDMSLVGPRPSLPTQRQLIDARYRRGVLRVRPGITGKAQVIGIDMSEPERLAETDAAYIAEQSFCGDLVLIVRTLAGAGTGDRIRSGTRGLRAR